MHVFICSPIMFTNASFIPNSTTSMHFKGVECGKSLHLSRKLFD